MRMLGRDAGCSWRHQSTGGPTSVVSFFFFFVHSLLPPFLRFCRFPPCILSFVSSFSASLFFLAVFLHLIFICYFVLSLTPFCIWSFSHFFVLTYSPSPASSFSASPFFPSSHNSLILPSLSRSFLLIPPCLFVLSSIPSFVTSFSDYTFFSPIPPFISFFPVSSIFPSFHSSCVPSYFYFFSSFLRPIFPLFLYSFLLLSLISLILTQS